MEYRLKGNDYIESLKVDLLVKEDIDDIVRMLQDPRVTEHLFFAPAPEEAFRAYFEPMASDIKSKLERGEMLDSLTFTLRDPEGNFIGDLGIIPVPMAPGVYEVGYQLDEPYWGRGIGTAACRLGIELAFGALEAHRVEANCYVENSGSRRVMEKNGMKLEGISRKFHRDGDRLADRANYSILREEFSL